jgi:hypothetical protein
MKFMIHYGGPSPREPEVVEASRLADHGHEGRWIDFLDANDDLVLRIQAADVSRVEHVRGEDPGSPPSARKEVPDLSRVLA